MSIKILSYVLANPTVNIYAKKFFDMKKESARKMHRYNEVTKTSIIIFFAIYL